MIRHNEATGSAQCPFSSSKSDPALAGELAAAIRLRLEKVGFKVLETPFGWLNEWRMQDGGESLAKVFKEL